MLFNHEIHEKKNERATPGNKRKNIFCLFLRALRVLRKVVFTKRRQFELLIVADDAR
jgi:hypothetical protein